ncbi:MAG: pseudouridine synthase [Desulfovibrio sp.]|nr:pseudouridine synthase [Desulfovibrio sp.]
MPGSLSYGKAVLIAADQLVNAVFGGWPDETLSSRAYRWARDDVRYWPLRIIEVLFWWEKEHCRESYESERLGRQLPPELR